MRDNIYYGSDQGTKAEMVWACKQMQRARPDKNNKEIQSRR